MDGLELLGVRHMFGEYSEPLCLEHASVAFAYLCVSLGPLLLLSIQILFP